MGKETNSFEVFHGSPHLPHEVTERRALVGNRHLQCLLVDWLGRRQRNERNLETPMRQGFEGEDKGRTLVTSSVYVRFSFTGEYPVVSTLNLTHKNLLTNLKINLRGINILLERTYNRTASSAFEERLN